MGSANRGDEMSKMSQAEVEMFLYQEAALLDAWKLDEWLALFTDDAIYEIPNPGSSIDTSSDRDLFLVADNRYRLGHRIERLKNAGAHSEWPRSRCTRTINNVRILAETADRTDVSAVFAAYRAKGQATDCFFGHLEYTLTRVGGVSRISRKRVTLGLENLNEHGRVSIIL
jgi:p-cumate 2,3-dioxygenase beta subunit